MMGALFFGAASYFKLISTKKKGQIILRNNGWKSLDSAGFTASYFDSVQMYEVVPSLGVGGGIMSHKSGGSASRFVTSCS